VVAVSLDASGEFTECMKRDSNHRSPGSDRTQTIAAMINYHQAQRQKNQKQELIERIDLAKNYHASALLVGTAMPRFRGDLFTTTCKFDSVESWVVNEISHHWQKHHRACPFLQVRGHIREPHR